MKSLVAERRQDMGRFLLILASIAAALSLADLGAGTGP
jgi:hypothetical protein